MPFDYECPHCKIGFSTGMWHYHGGSEYFGRWRLLCSSCHIQHELEIPFEPQATPYRLRSLPTLAINVEKHDGTALIFPDTWCEYRDIEGKERLDPERLKCQNCDTVGSLTEVCANEPIPCPHCGTKIEEFLCCWTT